VTSPGSRDHAVLPLREHGEVALSDVRRGGIGAPTQPQGASEIVIRLNRRTYSPSLRQVSLPETITVPWWEGRILRYEYA